MSRTTVTTSDACVTHLVTRPVTRPVTRQQLQVQRWPHFPCLDFPQPCKAPFWFITSRRHHQDPSQQRTYYMRLDISLVRRDHRQSHPGGLSLPMWLSRARNQGFLVRLISKTIRRILTAFVDNRMYQFAPPPPKIVDSDRTWTAPKEWGSPVELDEIYYLSDLTEFQSADLSELGRSKLWSRSASQAQPAGPPGRTPPSTQNRPREASLEDIIPEASSRQIAIRHTLTIP